MSLETVLSRLEHVRKTGEGRFLACCPAHGDKRASLSLREIDDGRVLLPRTTYEQIHVGERVDPSDARAGDLIFSNFSSPGVPEHVQIYAGDGKVIEAQQSGVPVKYSNAPTGSIVVKRVV